MTLTTLATRHKPKSKIEFSLDRRPHYLRVAIPGEASFDQTEVLSAQLLRMPLDGSWLVVLDLAQLTFLSSLAMGALNGYRCGVGRRGVEVRLANAQPGVWMALELAGLGKPFERIDLEEPAPNGGQRSGVAPA
jgi:anti-anti-sigma factor